jgi:hypothetical protein
MDAGGQPLIADIEFIQALAAANGLTLAPERAADLIPAVQAILDADAKLSVLHMGALPTTGLPWDSGLAELEI